MRKHGKAPQNKMDNVEKKHRISKNETGESSIYSQRHDVADLSLRETPFYPRMKDHAEILSNIPLTAQREEFIFRLHETYGNSYVQHLMKTMNVQAKLTVSNPNDIYEQEADRVADAATRALNSPTQRQEEEEELMQGKALVQRQTPEEEELLQGKALVQRQTPEEEELMQGKALVQRQTPEEEELMQGKALVQRQTPEEEELMQGKALVQRQTPEEEELMQGKALVQRQTPEEEELIQGKALVQRQTPEEEELLQGKALVQRQTPEEEELLQGKALVQRQPPEEEELQTQSNESSPSTVADNVETRINNARGSGQPLSDEVQKPMEQAFGADFSGVRVHNDPESDVLNHQLSAKAFTTGPDIFFRDGEYSPGSSNGQNLIAHELTHVMQQGAVGDQGRAEETAAIQTKLTNSIQFKNGDGDKEPEKELVLEDDIAEAVVASGEKGKKASGLADKAEGLKGDREKKKEAGVLGRLWNKHWKKGPKEKKVASTIGWLKTVSEGIMQILEWAEKLKVSEALGAITGIGAIIKRGLVFSEKSEILEVYAKSTGVKKRIKPSGTLGFRTAEKTATEYAVDKVLRAATWGLVRFIETLVNFFIGVVGDPTSKLVGGIIKGAMLLWQYGSRAVKAIVKEAKGIKGKNRREASDGIYDEAKNGGQESAAWDLVESIMRLKYPEDGQLYREEGELGFSWGFEFDEDKQVGYKEIKRTLYDSMSSKAESSLGGPIKEIGGELVG